MAITYNWNFSPLEIVYNEDAMADVIDIVHWQYSATDDVTGTSVQSIGTIKLPTPAPETFIPFADVTKAEVTTWVETAMGAEAVQSMQTNLANQIDTILHPTRGTVAPPWVDPNPPVPTE